jgi:hypothetical protein
LRAYCIINDFWFQQSILPHVSGQRTILVAKNAGKKLHKKIKKERKQSFRKEEIKMQKGRRWGVKINRERIKETNKQTRGERGTKTKFRKGRERK